MTHYFGILTRSPRRQNPNAPIEPWLEHFASFEHSRSLVVAGCPPKVTEQGIEHARTTATHSDTPIVVATMARQIVHRSVYSGASVLHPVRTSLYDPMGGISEVCHQKSLNRYSYLDPAVMAGDGARYDATCCRSLDVCGNTTIENTTRTPTRYWASVATTFRCPGAVVARSSTTSRPPSGSRRERAPRRHPRRRRQHTGYPRGRCNRRSRPRVRRRTDDRGRRSASEPGDCTGQEPRLPDLVDDIYLMGGAAMTTGNVTPMAEANFHNDPAAASRVLQDATTRMVGLDVTSHATVSRRLAERRPAVASGALAQWLVYRPDADLPTGRRAGHPRRRCRRRHHGRHGAHFSRSTTLR